MYNMNSPLIVRDLVPFFKAHNLDLTHLQHYPSAFTAQEERVVQASGVRKFFPSPVWSSHCDVEDPCSRVDLAPHVLLS